MIRHENYLISKRTTVRAGGVARYYFIAESLDDFKYTVSFFKDKGKNFYILGNGSKVIFSDTGVFGVVSLGGEFERFNLEGSLFEAGSACRIFSLLNFLRKKGLSGFEYFAGIPASVGGATYMNMGAFGHSISDFIYKVKVYDLEKDEIFDIDEKNLYFGYRHSIFKDNKSWIILKVYFKLKEDNPEKIDKRKNFFLSKRRQKQPSGFTFGSTFKNKGNIAAGKIIDEVGLKGLRVGGAYVSNKHANFIINDGTASADDILKLAYRVKLEVFEKTGILLEPEFILLGKWDDEKEEFLWKV